MKRKIYEQLLAWKQQRAGKTAVLVNGARRVGKSYIVEQFAKENYKSYILIDFSKASSEVKSLFDDYLDDMDSLFRYLSSYYGVELFDRESLFIFDEIQSFGRAREAIKYLIEDGRYDYIETGSLMSIRENVKDITLPSEEEHLYLHPMDFEEFMWAKGEKLLYEEIRRNFIDKKPMGQLLHRKAMDCFRQYMIVGGMPQAVVAYIETNDFNEVDRIKRNILTLYRNDIAKHAGRYALKTEQIFDEIPAQLQRHEKKFHITSLGKNSKMRDYEDAIFWLKDAQIINQCYNATEPSLGLRLNADFSSMKCYMADTGLLISHAFDEAGLVGEEVYKKILFDKLDFNGGMVAENIVAQTFVASGKKLYFYSKNSGDAEDRMEIDFLIAKSKITSRHNISPVEVKFGKNYTLSSIGKMNEKYANYLSTSYVIHTKDFVDDGSLVYLPFYMAGLL